MVKYGFFNAVKNHDGSYDRGYNAEDINKYFEGAMSENGIYKFVGNQCTVNAYNGMNVLVKDGKGAIKYHWFKLDTDEAVAITPAHPTLSRYTAIVARYDNSNRQIYLGTIDGEYEEIPSKPELIRSDSIYDLCLAYVYVEAGSTEITSENIQDTRGNEELCGFIKTLLDNGSGGGIAQVDHLPLPQASEIGKLYYLTVKDGDNEPGFYTCKRLTIYGYKDVNMLSGVIADRPDPQFEFANQVYYATDELKYYVCKKNDEGIYEWNEIEVTETSGLPTASVDTLNNYYLDTTDNTLHLGISEIGYGFAPFNGGGGNFAIIQISCPPGTNVRVSHNGEHQTKEVTDGIWLYGCIDAGEYVVAIPNTTAVQTVAITDKGQVESVYISEQSHSYMKIYHLGDECTDITTGYDVSGWSFYDGTWGGQCHTADIYPKVEINYNDYKYFYCYARHVRNAGFNLSIGINRNSSIYAPTAPEFANFKNNGGFRLLEVTPSRTTIRCACGCSGTGQTSYWTKSTNCFIVGNSGPRTSYTDGYVYSLGFVKEDDISRLSKYGEDISTILSNSLELFKDRTSLATMVMSCTGNFMISALSNSTFINAMNASENKDILQANEVWADFMQLLTV